MIQGVKYQKPSLSITIKIFNFVMSFHDIIMSQWHYVIATNQQSVVTFRHVFLPWLALTWIWSLRPWPSTWAVWKNVKVLQCLLKQVAKNLSEMGWIHLAAVCGLQSILVRCLFLCTFHIVNDTGCIMSFVPSLKA